MTRPVSIAALILAVSFLMPAQAQDLVMPTGPKEHADFQNWLCEEYDNGQRTPFDAQLSSVCPDVLEAKFRCKAGASNRGDVLGNCAESFWEHTWHDRPYCDQVKFWCEWGGGVFTILSR